MHRRSVPSARKRVARAARRTSLPAGLRSLFWDYGRRRIRLSEDHDLILSRVLRDGGWEATQWLRSRLGDAAIRDWLVRSEARGLSPQRIRFWQVVLDLSRAPVDAWLGAARSSHWHSRTAR